MSEIREVANTETPGSPEADPGFWYQLIDERPAADFLSVTPRFMQTMRQRGGGPRFVRLSARAVKYRRIDLREYSEARLRSSTADQGPEGAV